MADRRLTADFKLSEFVRSSYAARWRIDNTPTAIAMANIENILAPGMQRIRDDLGLPIFVESGYRCPKVNAGVGGASNSAHMVGLAADWYCPGYGTPFRVCRYLLPRMKALGIKQLIYEGTWVHTAFGAAGEAFSPQALTAHFSPDRKEVTYTPGIG